MKNVVIIKKGASEKNVQEKLRKLPNKHGFPASKYCGKVKVEEDPLKIQQQLRDEWEEPSR